jgi:hypothetical protein
MKRLVATGTVAFMLGCAAAQTPPSSPVTSQLSDKECGVDLGKYMNMPFDKFDQDLDGGWRTIAHKPGCERAASDLIALYRDENLGQQVAGLDWHEAQVRAAYGETERSIELFKRNLAFKRSRADAADSGFRADILYAEATIAFLERNLPVLKAKREELAALPKPDWFDQAAAEYKRQFPDSKVVMIWPTNLDTVDGLVACFDRPYKEAYSFACRPKRQQ